MRRSTLVVFFTLVATAVALHAQTFTKLEDFDGTDGSYSYGALIKGADGLFYSTTYNGGDSQNCFLGCGTVFKMTAEGALTRLHRFDQPDGSNPQAGLVQATDGNFYGTTGQGGSSYSGTIFQITSDGALTSLHSFTGADGSSPWAPLIQATDGNLYGTTYYGGADGSGTIFRLSLGDTLSTLHSFTGADGSSPWAPLIQASDGNFYGTTYLGGSTGNGSVFRITPEGALTTLHSFNIADGRSPFTALVEGFDGNFYGTTYLGGAYDCGTAFKITSGGSLTTLHDFDCRNDGWPASALVQASDGNFYGTTVYGGPSQNCFDGCGTVFLINPEGKLTTLYTFSGDDGENPQVALLEAQAGRLYGTTRYGGAHGQGTVFSLQAFELLSVTKMGSGTISSIDRHVYCGTVCRYGYPEAAPVTLSAVPAPGYTFNGWTGCDQMNGSYCSVTMTSAKNITATFTPANVTLSLLSFKPSYVRGGHLSAGTLTLSASAPPGGVTVALSSDHPGVAHPPSFVFIPGGKSSVQFAVNTFPVKSTTTVTITATAGASHVSGTLMVGTIFAPPAIH